MVLNKYLLWDLCLVLSSCFGEVAQIPVLQLLNLFPWEELWEVWLTLSLQAKVKQNQNRNPELRDFRQHSLNIPSVFLLSEI